MSIDRALATQIRKRFDDLLANLSPDLERWVREVAADDPARAVDLILRAAEFRVPKLSRQEVTGEDGGPVQVELVLLAGGAPYPTAIDITPAPASPNLALVPTPAPQALTAADLAPLDRAPPPTPVEAPIFDPFIRDAADLLE